MTSMTERPVVTFDRVKVGPLPQFGIPNENGLATVERVERNRIESRVRYIVKLDADGMLYRLTRNEITPA